MAPASNEEQFKFLISCIRHSNNGKVDFTEVAEECNIVSKGAAAKRYERMMKANGIHQSQSGGATGGTASSSIRDTPTASPRPKTSPSAGTNKRKRKRDNFAETTSNLNTDDDEGLSNDIKAEAATTVKDEPIKAEPVKEEPTGEEGTHGSSDSTDPFQYPSGGDMGFDSANDSAMFDDFLAFDGSSSQGHGSAAMIMGPATGTGDGQALHESIVIAD